MSEKLHKPREGVLGKGLSKMAAIVGASLATALGSCSKDNKDSITINGEEIQPIEVQHFENGGSGLPLETFDVVEMEEAPDANIPEGNHGRFYNDGECVYSLSYIPSGPNDTVNMIVHRTDLDPKMWTGEPIAGTDDFYTDGKRVYLHTHIGGTSTGIEIIANVSPENVTVIDEQNIRCRDDNGATIGFYRENPSQDWMVLTE